MKDAGADTEERQTIQTDWEELGISNDFLFGKIMQTPELCKELLHRILPELKIDHIKYPELQKSIRLDIDAHGIRLDVYVQDDKQIVYDIEMQVSNTRGSSKKGKEKQGMEARVYDVVDERSGKPEDRRRKNDSKCTQDDEECEADLFYSSGI